jgi:hypothetical protein
MGVRVEARREFYHPFIDQSLREQRIEGLLQ